MAKKSVILWNKQDMGLNWQVAILLDDDGLWVVANSPGLRHATRVDGVGNSHECRRAWQSIAKAVGVIE